MLEGVSSGRNEVGIGNISIRADRARILEFSYPMLQSGLSIMVRADEGQMNILHVVFSQNTLIGLGLIVLAILIPAHIFWLIARGRDEGLPIRRAYFPGIFDAITWCAECMGGHPQGYPKRVFPRIAALIWVYVGIVLIAYFTAFATTSLTLQSLRGIQSPNDLAGKRVAVVDASTGHKYIKTSRAQAVPFRDFSACAQALLDHKVDAVVYDTPVIQYYVRKDGKVRSAGAQFKPENYGIAFPLESPLRRKVNQALLELIEDGTYENLYQKWLGESDGSRPKG